jgi:hypothetical protein
MNDSAGYHSGCDEAYLRSHHEEHKLYATMTGLLKKLSHCAQSHVGGLLTRRVFALDAREGNCHAVQLQSGFETCCIATLEGIFAIDFV